MCCKGPLPLDTTLLGERAMKCRAYAKALHYREEEFHRGPNTTILESLIRSALNLLIDTEGYLVHSTTIKMYIHIHF